MFTAWCEKWDCQVLMAIHWSNQNSSCCGAWWFNFVDWRRYFLFVKANRFCNKVLWDNFACELNRRIQIKESYSEIIAIKKSTVLHRYFAPPPRFIANRAYRLNSRLYRFLPLKIPRYTAKLNYRHPPQVSRYKSRKTNLNSPVSTAHNTFWQLCIDR